MVCIFPVITFHLLMCLEVSHISPSASDKSQYILSLPLHICILRCRPDEEHPLFLIKLHMLSNSNFDSKLVLGEFNQQAASSIFMSPYCQMINGTQPDKNER